MYPSPRALSLVNHQSRDDLAKKYSTVMRGEENANIFIDLWLEVVETKKIWHYMWDLYLEENVPILKKLHEPFWSLHQTIIQEHVALRLARLLDEKKTSGNRNLSVSQIEDFFEGTDREEVESLLIEIKKKGMFLRRYRHKYIAHRDLDQLNIAFPSFTMGEVEDVLESIVSLIRLVEEKCKINDDSGWHDHEYNPSIRFMNVLRASLKDEFLEEEGA